MELVDYNAGTVAAIVARDPGWSTLVVAGVDQTENLTARRAVAIGEVIELKRTDAGIESLLEQVEYIASSPRFMLTPPALYVEVGRAASSTREALYEATVEATPVVVAESGARGWAGAAFRIPWRDILTALLRSYQTDTIRVSNELELAPTLDRLMAELRPEAELAELDPLVLAVGIVVFMARQANPEYGSDDDVPDTYTDVADWMG